jgi:hypothetical protein
VSKLTGSGGVAAGSPFSGGGLNLPKSIAFDSLGIAWIANSGNSSVSHRADRHCGQPALRRLNACARNIEPEGFSARQTLRNW